MNLDSLPKVTREFILPYLAEAWKQGYDAGIWAEVTNSHIDNPYKENR